jgi:hypothetical protein
VTPGWSWSRVTTVRLDETPEPGRPDESPDVMGNAVHVRVPASALRTLLFAD